MKNIVFGITSLDIGGAERVLIDLVNTLYTDYNITIFTLYNNGALQKYLNPNITVIPLYDAKYSNLNYFKKKIISLRLFFFGKYIYKKYIKDKFDTEIAFLEGPITNLFKYKNNNANKIAWIHTNVSKIFGYSIKAKLIHKINEKTYLKYNKIILVSEDSLNAFKNQYKCNYPSTIVLNNYIDINRIIYNSRELIDYDPLYFTNNQELRFLVVARLVNSKKIDRLISIHKNLIRERTFS